MYKHIFVCISSIFLLSIKGESILEVKELVNNETESTSGRENVTVNCKVISSDGENTVDKQVSWSKKDFLGPGFYDTNNGSESSKPKLTRVTIDDKGRYICTSMEDKSQDINATMIMTYNKTADAFQPKLVISKMVNGIEKRLLRSRIFVTSGDHFILTCKVKRSKDDDLSKNEVKWTRMHGELANHGDSYEIIFSPVVSDDRGLYACTSLKYNISQFVNVIVRRNIFEKLDNDKKERDKLHVLENELFNAQNKPQHPPDLINTQFGYIPDMNFNFKNFTTLNLDNDGHFDIDDTDKMNLTNSIFAVPGTILLVLFFAKLFYYAKTRYSLSWERLTMSPTGSCRHQICNRQSDSNSANCLLRRYRHRNRLSLLIVQRVMAANNSRNTDETDLPPSYNDSTMNIDSTANGDLPPSYNEVISGYENPCSDQNDGRTDTENRPNNNSEAQI